MSVILGIDLGTSSIKAMLLEKDRGVIAVESHSYEVYIPQINYAEQSPDIWWEALKNTLHRLKTKYRNEYDDIEAIGFSGQMHGMVLCDKEGNALRHAIIWLDQRSFTQLNDINAKIQFSEMGEIFCNRVFTGFAFPSLLWMKENEPDILENTYSIMQPKDFIRLKITGEFGTEVSDASATTLFNTVKREWAWNIIRRFKLPEHIFPKCGESTDIAGYVTKQCEQETGLREGIPVIYGAGDQPAQSIGNGVYQEGKIISNIGTGGQISTYIKNARYDKQLRTHTFCHAIDKAYTIFGATLCSGMSLSWFMNKVVGINDYQQINNMADEIPVGSDGLIYLPYLSGERTPHMNPNAKGIFFGLQLSHDRRHFIRSIMEGVTFSLKDSLNIFEDIGIGGDTIIASGGGAGSKEWLQIQADIFEKRVIVCQVREQACLGACILAGIGTGIFPNVANACENFVNFQNKEYEPVRENMKVYRESYDIFQYLYKQNAQLM